MKPIGLKATPCSKDVFREKLQLNETVETNLAYHVYLLSLSTKSFRTSKVLYTLAIDTHIDIIRENDLLMSTLSKLDRVIPNISFVWTDQFVQIYVGTIVLCTILFVTKDNCVGASVGKTITNYFYFNEPKAYQHKKWRERLDMFIYGYFGDKYPWLKL